MTFLTVGTRITRTAIIAGALLLCASLSEAVIAAVIASGGYAPARLDQVAGMLTLLGLGLGFAPAISRYLWDEPRPNGASQRASSIASIDVSQRASSIVSVDGMLLALTVLLGGLCAGIGMSMPLIIGARIASVGLAGWVSGIVFAGGLAAGVADTARWLIQRFPQSIDRDRIVVALRAWLRRLRQGKR